MCDIDTAGLFHDFGEEWQITLDTEQRVLVAVRRPTPTSQEVHVARTAKELRAKLEGLA